MSSITHSSTRYVGFDRVAWTLLRVPLRAWAAAADVTVANIDRCVDH